MTVLYDRDNLKQESIICSSANIIRNYKDSVFVDLFANDINASDNIVSLVNALLGSNFDKENNKFKITRIDNVMYSVLANDIGVTVDGRLLVLGEHQSTINENMPLRCLMYVGRIYESLVDTEKRYRKKLIKLPYPEFFVFYNGKKDYQDQELRLSDAFYEPSQINIHTNDKKEVPLEVVVHVININAENRSSLLEKCKVLKEYAEFISVTRKKWRIRMTEEEHAKCIKEAIDWCIENNILKEYLIRKKVEVTNMLIAEYNREEELAELKKELEEEAEEKIKKEKERANAEAERANTEAERADTLLCMVIRNFYDMKIPLDDVVNRFSNENEKNIAIKIYKFLNEDNSLFADELFQKLLSIKCEEEADTNIVEESKE